MNRISKFNKVIELKYLPKTYEFGTIYHCKQSKSIRYLCPDNECRNLVILPLSAGSYDSWCIQGRRKMFRQRESITLHPSV